MYHADYRMRFADQAQKHLTERRPADARGRVARYTALRDQIDLAVIAESARWGDTPGATPALTQDHWLGAINNEINNFFPERTQTVLDQLKTPRSAAALRPRSIRASPPPGSISTAGRCRRASS